MLKKFDLHSLDKKQGTALHWASFLGYENSVNYLTSLPDIDINLRDIGKIVKLN